MPRRQIEKARMTFSETFNKFFCAIVRCKVSASTVRILRFPIISPFYIAPKNFISKTILLIPDIKNSILYFFFMIENNFFIILHLKKKGRRRGFNRVTRIIASHCMYYSKRFCTHTNIFQCFIQGVHLILIAGFIEIMLQQG